MSRPIYDQNQGGYRIFIGNLSSRTNESEVQKECERYGSLINCWVARNPPGFAFVVYKHGDDAASAVRNMDGCILAGQRIRVEHAKARVVNSRNAPTYRDRDDTHSRNGARRSRRQSSDSRSRSRSNSHEHSKKKSSRPRHKHRSSSSGNEKSRRTKSKSPNDRSGGNNQAENSD